MSAMDSIRMGSGAKGPFSVRDDEFFVARAVGAPYRLVHGAHGVFLVNRNDFYIGQALELYGEYCEYEWQVLSAFAASGRDAIEVGANIGSHTVPLARQLAARGRRLLAVEAQRIVFQMLCANVALNALPNVLAENVACGEGSGWVGFEEPDYNALGNFGSVSMGADAAGRQRVRLVPLDDLVPLGMDVGLLKLDVEGFEQKVLEGARRTIQRCRPVIYLENDRVDRSQSLIELLWSSEYDIWWHISSLYRPDNFRGNSQNIYGNVASFNMLAAPKEARITVQGAEKITDSAHHPLKQRT
jgi:FkbM family methyltransferase